MTMGWCVIVAVGKWSVGVVAFGNWVGKTVFIKVLSFVFHVRVG